MKTVIIDGRDIKDKQTLHLILKRELNFPEYYGKNLDALWDCLTVDTKMPLEIVWKNFKYSKEHLGEYADMTVELLSRVEEHFKGEFKVKIQ
ncbi:barstar family protein [Clostridium felsineum]|uniref:barstar family protein n=1 Tax=Clostridium felsineum TaxID=36839 RepID=UPI00214DB63B|nr:barstar family protein [Clostridium felsineum]MCR3761292.1 barstar family protein [Clostridium felsineum]